MIVPQDYYDDPQFRQLEAVFHDYVAQGEGRNISWLVAKTGLPLTVVARGITRGMWIQRIQEIATDAAKTTRQQLVGDVAGLNSRDVAILTDLVDAADAALLKAIREDRVSPATLAKISFDARSKRREILGLGAGQDGDLMGRMAKLLEDSSTATEAKPFVLDLKKIAPPADLPTMPGMTSDADVGRELDDDEKERLRG